MKHCLKFDHYCTDVPYFLQLIAHGPVGDHGGPVPQHVAKELNNEAEL